jgi:putative transposase
MPFEPNCFLHIYNQGNNKQRIFFEDSNYIFFLEKIRKHIRPHCKILGYCLMPNHFHFLVYTTENSIQKTKVGVIELNILVNGFRSIQSSYAQAINKSLRRSGSLFRQKTKFKFVADDFNALNCLNYIHQNPIKAGLVERMEYWRYSSFRDYCELRDGTMCDKVLSRTILRINEGEFYDQSYKHIALELEGAWLQKSV